MQWHDAQMIALGFAGGMIFNAAINFARRLSGHV
jgi:hypothetical protein